MKKLFIERQRIENKKTFRISYRGWYWSYTEQPKNQCDKELDEPYWIFNGGLFIEKKTIENKKLQRLQL